jgi:hypothetical protein
MNANASLAGVGLVFGAALGCALTLVIADAAKAPMGAALGAGLGLVFGAALASFRSARRA